MVRVVTGDEGVAVGNATQLTQRIGGGVVTGILTRTQMFSTKSAAPAS
jgi:hypothetical protein